jgi:L-asparaginase
VKIELVTTGGSIAELFENGTVRHLSGEELATELLRGMSSRPELLVNDLLSVPSTWITPHDMREIGRAVLAAQARPDVAGVVVDLMLDGDKPAVFTGAQRYPGRHGYDGYMNLQDAIAVAGSPLARSLGALAVMNGEIHLARDVMKVHAGSMAAFASPGWGPVGGVHLDTVRIARRPTHRFEPISPDGALPRVDVLATYTGMDGALLDASIAGGARGVVIQAMSSVGIPDTLVEAVAAAAARVPVVIVSRCFESGVIPGSLSHEGLAGYSAELRRLGVAISGLQALKARCRLMALIAAGADAETARLAMDDVE